MHADSYLMAYYSNYYIKWWTNVIPMRWCRRGDVGAPISSASATYPATLDFAEFDGEHE